MLATSINYRDQILWLSLKAHKDRDCLHLLYRWVTNTIDFFFIEQIPWMFSKIVLYSYLNVWSFPAYSTIDLNSWSKLIFLKMFWYSAKNPSEQIME